MQKYFALYQDLGKLVDTEVNYAVLMFNDEHVWPYGGMIL